MNVRHILLMAKVSVASLEKAKNELDTIAAEIREGKISFEEAWQNIARHPKKARTDYF